MLLIFWFKRLEWANHSTNLKGGRPEMTEAQKRVEWGIIPGGHEGEPDASFTMQRAKVPGGWLVYVFGHGYSFRSRSIWGHGGLTFYPDPEHKWDGNSLA